MADMRVAAHPKRRHTKVRSGCITCKRRRVKCDETKPSCRRCAIYGVPCEGYQTPTTWLFEPQPKNSESKSQQLLLFRPVKNSNDQPSENRALVYFNERTAPLLTRFNSVASELWKFVIPQVSNSEEPLRHLMIAAASRQELLHSSAGTPLEVGRLSIAHYAKAIKMLTNTAKQPSPEVMLMCCLMFITCENLQASPLQSLPHLRAGLKILREWEASNSSNRASGGFTGGVIRQLIEPTFARLEAAATFPGHVPSSVFEQHYDLNWSEPKLPDAFLDPLTMRESFHDLCQWLYFQSKQHADFWTKDSLSLRNVKGLFCRWHTLAWQFAKDQGHRRLSAQREVLAFDAHYQAVWLLLNCATSPTEMIYDRFLNKLRDILRVCYILCDAGIKDIASGIFELSPGMVPPVFVTAAVCREPKVRERAISLLHKMHSERHGPDDQCSAARLAETIRDLEEAGPGVVKHCGDIPESRRIRPLAMDLRKRGKLILIYTRSPYATAEQVEVPLRAENVPAIMGRLAPPSECVRLAGYQGLVRASTPQCVCKTFGTV